MVEPVLMTFGYWSATVGDMLERRFRGIIRPLISDTEKWKSWADIVTSHPEITRLCPPRPDGYDNWQSWARAFNTAVRY